MKFNKLVLWTVFGCCFCFNSYAADQTKEKAVNSVPGKSHITWGYKEKSPEFEEIFSDAFREMYNSKKSSTPGLGEGGEMFISMSCVSFSYYEKADLNNPKSKKWLVRVEWKNGETTKNKELVVKASTRELAASYSMCRVWGEEKIKFGQISGSFVEEIEIVNGK